MPRSVSAPLPRLRARVACAALAVSLAAPAGAAEPTREVYAISPWADGAVIAAAALGSAIPYALGSRLIDERCPCAPREVNAFDRGVIGNRSDFADHLSDASIGAIVVGPLLFDLGALGPGRAFLEDAVVYAEVIALNGAAATAAKYATQRPIPRTYAGDPDLLRSPNGYRSFYSGHTSLAFATLSTAAMTADLRYHAGWWPWLAAGVLGSSVAAERVLAGRHFYSDVIVGAVAGTAVGIAVPLLHRRGPGAPRLAAVPFRGGVALTISGRN